MDYSNVTPMLFILSTVLIFAVYCSIIIYKNKDKLTEAQERRVSTLVLLMLFFVLSMIYRELMGNSCFIVMWFVYAMYHSVRDLHRTISIRCDKGMRMVGYCDD